MFLAARSTDGPGRYRVEFPHGLPVRTTSGANGETVGHVPSGTIVNVVEVSAILVSGQVRARIECPAGWISVATASGRRRFAARQDETMAVAETVKPPVCHAEPLVKLTAADEFGCITVSVHSMAGRKLLECSTDPNSTVLDLKVRIGDCLQIPPLCQKLVVGSSVPQDTVSVASLCTLDTRGRVSDTAPASASVGITLVVSPQPAFEAATSDDPFTRRAAVESFAQVAYVDMDHALHVLNECCRDRDQRVRHIALQALARVARPEDEKIVDDIFRRHFDHQDFFDRRVALDSLAELCERLHREEASSVVSSRLHRPWSRAAVAKTEQEQPSMVKLFADLAQKGKGLGVVALCVALEHNDEELRRSAAKALESVVPRGDASASAQLRRRLQLTQGRAKQAVCEVLSRIAAVDDPQSTAALWGCLMDWDGDVRAGAVQALRNVVQPTNVEAVEATASLLEHQHDRTRAAASAALLGIVMPRPPLHAITVVSRRLEHRDERVRVAAADALRKMSRAGDERIRDAVMARLDHQSESVRRSAAKFLAATTQAGKERPISASSCGGQCATAVDGAELARSSRFPLLQPLLPPGESRESGEGHPKAQRPVANPPASSLALGSRWAPSRAGHLGSGVAASSRCSTSGSSVRSTSSPCGKCGGPSQSTALASDTPAGFDAAANARRRASPTAASRDSASARSTSSPSTALSACGRQLVGARSGVSLCKSPHMPQRSVTGLASGSNQ